MADAAAASGPRPVRLGARYRVTDTLLGRGGQLQGEREGVFKGFDYERGVHVAVKK